MGEYADEAVARMLGETPRQRNKRERIRQAALKEDRQIRAMIAKQDYCLDQLPDLDGEDDAD